MVIVKVLITPYGVQRSVVEGDMPEGGAALQFYWQLKPLLQRLDGDVKELLLNAIKKEEVAHVKR